MEANRIDPLNWIALDPISVTLIAKWHDFLGAIWHCRPAGAAMPHKILLDKRGTSYFMPNRATCDALLYRSGSASTVFIQWTLLHADLICW